MGVQPTMQIDYEAVIKKCLGPKLAYHGFKYKADMSSPQAGRITFARNYWCKLQYVIISRVRHTSEGAVLESEHDDQLSEIHSEIVDDDLGVRLWLSNRYISALVGQEYGGVDITRGGIGDFKPFEVLAHTPEELREVAMNELQRNHQWWRFENEADLRNVLHNILQTIITEGLNWFEEQIVDIKRYHQKLDSRRLSELSKITREVPLNKR